MEKSPIRVVAIETATPRLGVALGEGERCAAQAALSAGMRHAEELLPLLDALLKSCGWKKEDLRAVCVSRGPGSFTGIRVGVAMARGMAQGLGIQAVGVSTLEALAEPYRWMEDRPVAALMDALRGHCFCACYQKGKTLMAPGCRTWESAFASLRRRMKRGGVITGQAAESHRESIQKALGKAVVFPEAGAYPDAESVLRLGVRALKRGKVLPYQKLTPEYLREAFTTVAPSR